MACSLWISGRGLHVCISSKYTVVKCTVWKILIGNLPSDLILIHFSYLVIVLLCKLSNVLTCHLHILGHAILSKKYSNLKLKNWPQAALQAISSNESVFISCCCFFLQSGVGRQNKVGFFLVHTLKLTFLSVLRLHFSFIECLVSTWKTFQYHYIK